MKRGHTLLLSAMVALSTLTLLSACDSAFDEPVATTSGALAVIDLERAAPDLTVTTEVRVALVVPPSLAPEAVQTRKYEEVILIHLIDGLHEPPGPCPLPRVVITASGEGVDPVEVELVADDDGEVVVPLVISGLCETAPCTLDVDLTIVRDPGEAGPATLVIERR